MPLVSGRIRRGALAPLLVLAALIGSACTVNSSATSPAAPKHSAPHSSTYSAAAQSTARASRPAPVRRTYPVHTGIVATTFWVGEVFDPNAADGSQVYSTYDSYWEKHYGGCDGVVIGKKCSTERRFARNGFFPLHMKPRQNPFYLDLPYDDVNDPVGFAQRCKVIPWANDPKYRGHCTDPNFSYLKNRWVRITGPNHHTCYGQIEDAGPGQYHDSRYVFGKTNARPVNARYGGAGADVSPALNSCLGFRELDGDTDKITWSFVEGPSVPRGPWYTVRTWGGIVE